MILVSCVLVVTMIPIMAFAGGDDPAAEEASAPAAAEGGSESTPSEAEDEPAPTEGSALTPASAPEPEPTPSQDPLAMHTVSFVLSDGWTLASGADVWTVQVADGATIPFEQIPDLAAVVSEGASFLGWLPEASVTPVQSDYIATLPVTGDMSFTASFEGSAVSAPLGGITPLFAPIGAGIVEVTDWADLRNAITTANAGTSNATTGGSPITTIKLKNNIQRAGGTAATNDLPAITGTLTIDGGGFTLDFRNGGAATAINTPGFTLSAAGTTQRVFTLKNINIERSNVTITGEIPAQQTAVKPLVSVGNVAINATTAPGSQYWTANFENINAYAGAPQPVTGLAMVYGGSVNLGGTINWSSDASIHRRITARNVTVLEGANVTMNLGNPDTRSATIGSAYVIRAYSIEFQKNSTTTMANTSSVIRLYGSGTSYFRALSGATVNLTNNYTGRASIATSTNSDSWAQCVYFGAPGNGLRAGDTFTIDGATVTGTSWGGAENGDTAGTFNLFSEGATSTVNIDIKNGGKLNATSNGMQAAFTSNVPSGAMNVDGEGSELNLTSKMGYYHVVATLRFREYGNQTLKVTNNAEVHITKAVHDSYLGSAAAPNAVNPNGNGDVAAVRFGQGANNKFTVESGGKIYVETWGTGSPRDPGNPNLSGDPGYQNGNNVAIEVANTGFQFNVSGETSVISVVAHNGAAFNAGTNGNVSINVTDGSFYAVGKTNSATAGIFKATGNASTFTFTSPRFYDFRNDRAASLGGGLIFQTGAGSRFTHTASDLAVWEKGDELDYDDPYFTLTRASYVLAGTNFGTIESSDTHLPPGEFAREYRDMTYYSRMSGNNAAALVGPWAGLTNADKTARVFSEVPEGLTGTLRKAWTDEIHAIITFTRGGVPTDVLVSSKLDDPIYEEESSGELHGVLPYNTGQFLRPGDTFVVNRAWSGPLAYASEPDARWNRQVPSGNISAGTGTVIDITPPTPAVITTASLFSNQTALTGTWSTTAPVYDDAATALEVWLSVGGTGTPAKMTGASGTLNADGTWNVTLPASTIAQGDKIWVRLLDAGGNINPLNDTPTRDTTFLAAASIIVEGARKGEITGLLFTDANKNGIYDTGDGILAGQTVTLYKSSDRTTAVSTATSDASGNYKFSDVVVGDYVVKAPTVSDYGYTTLITTGRDTTKIYSDVDNSGYSPVLEVNYGNAEANLFRNANAGYAQPTKPGPGTGAFVKDLVAVDGVATNGPIHSSEADLTYGISYIMPSNTAGYNHLEILDIMGAGLILKGADIANVSISAKRGTTTVPVTGTATYDAATRTVSYKLAETTDFATLADATITLTVVAKLERVGGAWPTTITNTGRLIVNNNTGGGIDDPNTESNNGLISGIAFTDADRNGIFAAGTDTLLAGVPVVIKVKNGTAWDVYTPATGSVATTDANGAYKFEVAAGTYRVEFPTPHTGMGITTTGTGYAPITGISDELVIALGTAAEQTRKVDVGYNTPTPGPRGDITTSFAKTIKDSSGNYVTSRTVTDLTETLEYKLSFTVPTRPAGVTDVFAGFSSIELKDVLENGTTLAAVTASRSYNYRVLVGGTVVYEGVATGHEVSYTFDAAKISQYLVGKPAGTEVALVVFADLELVSGAYPTSVIDHGSITINPSTTPDKTVDLTIGVAGEGPEIEFTQYPLVIDQTPLSSHELTADELKVGLRVTDDADYPTWISDTDGRAQNLYKNMVVTPLDSAGATKIDTRNIGVYRVRYVATDSTGNITTEYRAVVVTDGRYIIEDEDGDGKYDIILGARNFVVQQSAVQRNESA
ncbi:MAG: isopeptide-forming domain-containing fimbrial protein, partial [Coriobacteriales bacterium]|nr:isopeptide-forming domain-containing fimbrial protein [Coriobacteriales bacterium]